MGAGDPDDEEIVAAANEPARQRDEAFERGWQAGLTFSRDRMRELFLEHFPAPPKIPFEQRPLSERRKLALRFWMKGAGFWSILIFTPFFIVFLASGRPVPGVVWGVAALDAFYAILIGYSVLAGYMPQDGRK